MTSQIAKLVKGMLSGSEACLARLVTLVETDNSTAPEIMEAVSAYSGKAYCVGITGTPGVGKSTITDRLAAIARSKGLSVGIVAVDPSSAFHGGAVLGDRIRMQKHFLDDKVFIRSVATRGAVGGLSRNAKSIVRLLDAYGKDIVIVETVGAGQTDVGIREVADIVVAVLSPDWGDGIQIMKAGLIEIADVIAVNKADRGSAEVLISELSAYLSLCSSGTGRHITVLATQAVNNIGIKELYEELESRRRAIQTN